MKTLRLCTQKNMNLNIIVDLRPNLKGLLIIEKT